MSLISFIVIGIGVIIISMIFLIISIKTNKRNVNNKPYLLSLVALSLILLNWLINLALLYLTDFSTLIRFTSVWLIVSIIGFIAAYKEFRNDRSFAVVVGGLVVINSILGMLLWAMSKM